MLAPDSAVIEAGGVGYRVFCGPATLTVLKEGTDARLYTHHLVREDTQALYGFRSTEELGFFELLTTVTGVGPKVALAIVSSRPVADLQLAILQGDEGVLTAVSGRGQEARRPSRPRVEGKGVRGRRGWRFWDGGGIGGIGGQRSAPGAGL